MGYSPAEIIPEGRMRKPSPKERTIIVKKGGEIPQFVNGFVKDKRRENDEKDFG